MEDYVMGNQEMLQILYKINACLNYKDWINAKEYIKLEIKKLNCKEHI